VEVSQSVSHSTNSSVHLIGKGKEETSQFVNTVQICTPQ